MRVKNAPKRTLRGSGRPVHQSGAFSFQGSLFIGRRTRWRTETKGNEANRDEPNQRNPWPRGPSPCVGSLPDARRRALQLERCPPRYRVGRKRSFVLSTVEGSVLQRQNSSSGDGPFSGSSVRGPFTWGQHRVSMDHQGVGVLPILGVSGCRPLRTEGDS